MTSYIAFELHGRKFRYYDEDRVEIEKVYKNKKFVFKPITFSNKELYKRCEFMGNGKRITMYLHRLVYYAHNQEWDIYDNSPDNKIDHIKHEECVPLDNSISNLRIVNAQQNSFNKNCKGYYFNKRSNKYHATINVNNKKIHLGLYDTEKEARQVYLNAKEQYHKMPE